MSGLNRPARVDRVEDVYGCIRVGYHTIAGPLTYGHFNIYPDDDNPVPQVGDFISISIAWGYQ